VAESVWVVMARGALFRVAFMDGLRFQREGPAWSPAPAPSMNECAHGIAMPRSYTAAILTVLPFRMPTLPFRLPAATLLLSLWLGGCASDDLSPSHDRSRSPIPFQAFEDADTNHDGRLDRDEVAAVPDFEPLSRVFERIDADHSGYLSWNEIRAGRFPFYRLPPLPKQ